LVDTIQVKSRAEITSLTSLRFFAAAMIVWCHSLYGLKLSNEVTLFGLVQGVSLFFVLSGFVLTYVYGNGFADWKAILRFYGSRVARVWPAHVATNILFMLSLPAIVWFNARPLSFLGIMIMNFLMLQSLGPYPRYYHSLNTPSWSISTEFCFYLLFPMLLQVFRRKWYVCALICLGTLIVSLVLAFLCNWFPENVSSVRIISWLLTINPLARLFEFVLGMIACKAMLKYRAFLVNRTALVTALELTAVGLLAIAVISAGHLSNFVYTSPSQFVRPLALWCSLCDGCIPDALLIFALSLQSGLIARFLSLPYLVKLGDISYSIYLLHYLVLLWFQVYWTGTAKLEAQTSILAYWVVLIVVSKQMHKHVEVPFRKAIKDAAYRAFS
jgi:peptidoglycan/LPS O-acetylase OafA/YrhL